MSFTIERYAGPAPDVSESAAELLREPEVVLTAEGTCVVPAAKQR
jgi:3-aminobutyryl-CoA ammonia-lyase